ncbi:hypothetical protein M9458_001989, partial [Cirrhinus mrigala]
MTPAWTSVDLNARPDGETGIPDCVFVKKQSPSMPTLLQKLFSKRAVGNGSARDCSTAAEQ